MPRRFTMSVLLDRCRKRADKVGDESLSDADLQALISEVYGELYSLVAETGHRYFETYATISTTGAASYTEPADHLGTVRMERVLDSAGRTTPLREVGAREQTYWNGSTGTARVFALVDDQIYLYPVPASGAVNFCVNGSTSRRGRGRDLGHRSTGPVPAHRATFLPGTSEGRPTRARSLGPSPSRS